MSNFIDKTDYEFQIRDYKLDQIIDEDDSILDGAEEEAIAEVDNYLFERYDTDYEFGQTGSSRNKVLLRYVKNCVLYHIYERVSDELVPERVIKNYDDTIALLEKIQAGDMAMKIKRLENADGTKKTVLRWGSDARRNNAT